MKLALPVSAWLALSSAAIATAETAARPRPARARPKPVESVSAHAQPTDGDGWTVTREKNPANDKPVVTAVLRADAPVTSWTKTVTPTLVVSCQTPWQVDTLPPFLPAQPGLEVYIVTGSSRPSTQRGPS